MKKVAYIVSALILIVACIFGFIFSPFGSKFIAGKIEKEALTRGIEVKFKDFSLGFNTLNLEATVMNAINLKANGELWFCSLESASNSPSLYTPTTKFMPLF